jgi:hypothetical protein
MYPILEGCVGQHKVATDTRNEYKIFLRKSVEELPFGSLRR